MTGKEFRRCWRHKAELAALRQKRSGHGDRFRSASVGGLHRKMCQVTGRARGGRAASPAAPSRMSILWTNSWMTAVAALGRPP
jgi:hypothetical protein